jgi:hypothetical protein
MPITRVLPVRKRESSPGRLALWRYKGFPEIGKKSVTKKPRR